MLTFKATLKDAEEAFCAADDRRDNTIHAILAVFHEKNGRPRAARLVERLKELSAVQDDYDKASNEVLRLDRIEHFDIDEIIHPFPPHITTQLRAAGLSDEDMRDIAKEIQEDSALIRPLSEMTDIGLARYAAAYRASRTRPSLHGDGHVGPVRDRQDDKAVTMGRIYGRQAALDDFHNAAYGGDALDCAICGGIIERHAAFSSLEAGTLLHMILEAGSGTEP